MDGFQKAAGLSRAEAAEQWAWYSRQLSDREIRRIERGGFEAGLRMGEDFRNSYPEEEEG